VNCRRGALLGIMVLALGLIGLAPSSSRSLQLWPDHSVGVTNVLLEDMSGHADSQVFPWGVHRTAEGEIMRARTYLHFPLDAFPPGTDILRATLHVYVDTVSDAGEATFGAYRVLEPWEEGDLGDDPADWPTLLTTPIALTEARFDVMTSTLPLATPIATNTPVVPSTPTLTSPPPTSTPVVTPTPTLTTSESAALFSRPPGHGLVQDVMVAVVLSDQEVSLGFTTVVSIQIENVINLCDAEVNLTFDSTLLEVVDAAPDTEGVQIQAGDFFSPELSVRNIVYQDYGEINFAIFQLGVTEPVSGSGVLAAITFRGKEVGVSEIEFEDVFLEDCDGESIVAGTRAGSITVFGEGTPTPTVTSTPEATPTAPISPLPTPTPGPTPTPPPPSGVLPVSLQPGEGTWLTWNVTALMRAWLAGEVPNHGLALAAAPHPDADVEEAGDLLVARWLAATDLNTRPYLVVEFDVLPVTPTPTATPVPILPPAGGTVGWKAVGVLFIGAALLALGLTVRRR
jgi:hypothetical protein